MLESLPSWWSWSWVAAILAVIVGPIIGGLLFGIDRKLTAHMQDRVGPPIRQPFYDVRKLFGKEAIYVNKVQTFWICGFFAFIVSSLFILYLGQDWLLMLFTLALADVCLVLAALSVKSPYSHIGGHRELIQVLACDPILFLTAVAIFLTTGSFLIKDIFAAKPLLYSLPLVFISLLVILITKMRKSPFDIAASEHAHQEIVRGTFTEFSGPYLGLIEIGEWYALVLCLSLIAFFFAQPLWVGYIIAFAAFFLMLIIDNITARLTYTWLLKGTWAITIPLVMINIILVVMGVW
jgi:formate hydrogenlyase subunit 4